MPLYYQNFKSYAQAIADKTARQRTTRSPLPEIWGCSAWPRRYSGYLGRCLADFGVFVAEELL